MAFPERDDDFTLLILLLLLADRTDIDLEEIEPYIDSMLTRLELNFDRQERSSEFPFPPDYLFRFLRRSISRGRIGGRRSRVSDVSDQIYWRLSERLDLMSSDLDRRISNLEVGFEERMYNAEEVRETERSYFLSAIEKASDSIKTLEWVLSIGVNPAEMVTNRSVPVRVYLPKPSSEADHAKIINGIVSVLEGLSFERDLELPEENGSWWKRLWMRSKDLATQEQIHDRLIKIERAAETRYLDKPQAEANKDHAAAVATIMKSLENVNSACVQIGNILLVKHAPNKKDARVMVRTLNAIEMNTLEKNQSLLRNPSSIIQKLQALSGEGGMSDIRP